MYTGPSPERSEWKAKSVIMPQTSGDGQGLLLRSGFCTLALWCRFVVYQKMVSRPQEHKPVIYEDHRKVLFLTMTPFTPTVRK